MKRSAGILAFKKAAGVLSVLLVHPGGPFFMNKDLGSWSIPKGEYDEPEDPFICALREFTEETGQTAAGKFIELQPVKIKSGKIIKAWAVECDVDLKNFSSNSFSLEWPPKSGRIQEFPEADKAEWFAITMAEKKINSGQLPLLSQLKELI